MRPTYLPGGKEVQGKTILKQLIEEMSAPTNISHSQFGDHTIIHQGNVHGNVYYGTQPHPPARAEVVRVIPYPRNEDLVHRRDLIDKLDELLPQTTSSSCSAALWGLGGSGYVSTFGMLP